MAGADRNRVQAYLDSQRDPNASSAMDVGLFLRDLTDPGTSDDQVQQAHDTLAAQGKSPAEIGQTFLQGAARQNTQDYVARRNEALQRYTDATQRNQATAEAETGAQSVARILAELTNAYAGGKPGAVTETLNKHRDEARARADQQAQLALGVELQGIEGERQDQRSYDATAAANARAGAQIKAQGDRTTAEIEGRATEGKANRENAVKIAGMRPQGGGFTPNSQAELLQRADKVDRASRSSLQALDRALDVRVSGVKDLDLLYNYIHNMDATAVREGELAMAQRAQDLLGRIERMVGGLTEGQLISDDLRKQIREELQITRRQIQQDRSMTLGGLRKVARDLQAVPSIQDQLAQMEAYGAESTAGAPDSAPAASSAPPAAQQGRRGPPSRFKLDDGSVVRGWKLPNGDIEPAE